MSVTQKKLSSDRRQFVLMVSLVNCSVYLLSGLLDSKLSFWAKLLLHLLYHIWIMRLCILAQAMEIHRLVDMMFVYVCLFFSLCLESIFLNFKVNSASILS